MWTADSRCKASDGHRDEVGRGLAAGIQKGLHRIARRVGQLLAERATGVSFQDP